MDFKGLYKKFPYLGVKNWVLICSLTFITAQLLWYCSRFVRNFDFLEMPMVILFFPLAPLFDPHDAMLRDEDIFIYAIIYWLIVFFLSLIISRMKINPVVPAIVIVLLSCAASLGYGIYLLWRGPIIMATLCG